MNQRKSPFAPGSSPDIAARLRETLAANTTAREVLNEGMQALTRTLDGHLGEIETRLARLLADIEGRSDASLR